MLKSHFKGLCRASLWRLGYLIGATDVFCSRSTQRGGRWESVTDGPVRRAHIFLARKDRLLAQVGVSGGAAAIYVLHVYNYVYLFMILIIIFICLSNP